MSIAIIWFRQDLRLTDNPAYINACNNHDVIIPLYINDSKASLKDKAQGWWLHHSLISLHKSLKKLGLNLVLRSGNPIKVFKELTSQLDIATIYWNRCYDPIIINRDEEIELIMQQRGVRVISSNGSLLIDPCAIKNKKGDFFKVFTPFWRHCLQKISIPEMMHFSGSVKGLDIPSDCISDWELKPSSPDWAVGFSNYWQPGEDGAEKKLDDFISNILSNYKLNRDIPALNATSKLSAHLHFGEISPWSILREVEKAKLHEQCNISSAEHFLSEMGWREFSYYLLYHSPTITHENFRKEFDFFPWHFNEYYFECWKKGTTGYPLIDAGMRELWQTGYMHNRVRMISASFLTKNLLIDWRIGADWFLNTLLDADLANNSVSWQWVAGSGIDAAPYFRIFNPVLQSEKFDSSGEYIRKWVPELSKVNKKYIHKPWMFNRFETGLTIGIDYPKPIVSHIDSRKKALGYYKLLKEHKL